MRNWRFDSPLGITPEEYALLGPAGKDFCWKRRLGIALTQKLPAFVTSLPWDPEELDELTDIRRGWVEKMKARYERQVEKIKKANWEKLFGRRG